MNTNILDSNINAIVEDSYEIATKGNEESISILLDFMGDEGRVKRGKVLIDLDKEIITSSKGTRVTQDGPWSEFEFSSIIGILDNHEVMIATRDSGETIMATVLAVVEPIFDLFIKLKRADGETGNTDSANDGAEEYGVVGEVSDYGKAMQFVSASSEGTAEGADNNCADPDTQDWTKVKQYGNDTETFEDPGTQDWTKVRQQYGEGTQAAATESPIGEDTPIQGDISLSTELSDKVVDAVKRQAELFNPENFKRTYHGDEGYADDGISSTPNYTVDDKVYVPPEESTPSHDETGESESGDAKVSEVDGELSGTAADGTPTVESAKEGTGVSNDSVTETPNEDAPTGKDDSPLTTVQVLERLGFGDLNVEHRLVRVLKQKYNETLNKLMIKGSKVAREDVIAINNIFIKKQISMIQKYQAQHAKTQAENIEKAAVNGTSVIRGDEGQCASYGDTAVNVTENVDLVSGQAQGLKEYVDKSKEVQSSETPVSSETDYDEVVDETQSEDSTISSDEMVSGKTNESTATVYTIDRGSEDIITPPTLQEPPEIPMSDEAEYSTSQSTENVDADTGDEFDDATGYDDEGTLSGESSSYTGGVSYDNIEDEVTMVGQTMEDIPTGDEDLFAAGDEDHRRLEYASKGSVSENIADTTDIGSGADSMVDVDEPVDFEYFEDVFKEFTTSLKWDTVEFKDTMLDYDTLHTAFNEVVESLWNAHKQNISILHIVIGFGNGEPYSYGQFRINWGHGLQWNESRPIEAFHNDTTLRCIYCGYPEDIHIGVTTVVTSEFKYSTLISQYCRDEVRTSYISMDLWNYVKIVQDIVEKIIIKIV